MATEWVKQSRSARMSNASALAGPMSFNSGLFTHALATLAIDKRTEREKVALVEALLLSRVTGNSQKAKAKLAEFKQLRHKIIRDHWNKAIHQVIIQYNIPERIKSKRAASDANHASSQQSLPAARPDRKVGTETQVRFNLETTNQETAYSAPQRPGRQRHSQHRPRNKLQVPVSSAAAFPAFNPNTQMQNQIYVHPSFSSAAWTSSMNQMRAFPASFNSDRCHAFPHHPCPPACPSTTHVAASCSVSTEPSSDVLSGPFPSAASQLHPPAVTTHDSSMQLSAAAPSSCPTESSQASEMSVPQAPQSSTRQTHASQNAQQSAQTAHSAAFHTSSSSHQTRGLALPPQSPYEHTVSALSACTLHNSPHNTGRDNSGTPSCSTESSSEAGDAAIKVCVQTPGNVQKVQHEATAPSPHVAVKPWARVGNSSAAHGSISGSSIATESSVSVQSVKASQPQAAPGFGARSRSHRCSAKARPTGAAGCGHAAAARESQRTNFASSSSHSGLHRPAGLRPGQSIGTPAVGDAPEWSTALNTPQTPFRCATDGVVRLGGIPCLPHVAGAKASGRSSSGGSYESSSRPSFSGAGGIRVSSVERLDDASSHHESRSQHMLGGKLSAAAGGYPRGSAVGAARGMHSGMRSHARAVGTPPQWQRGGRTTAAGVDLSTRSRQIRPGLPVGVIPSTCDSALERECDGSDATEPSDDEDN